MATKDGQSPDLGKPQFASHSWMEPVIVITIMVSSVILNRHRNFSILNRQRQRSHSKPLLDEDSETDLFLGDTYNSDDEPPQPRSAAQSSTAPKQRSCLGKGFTTPNTYRFRNHLHSRFIQKFPFLVEMFYWALNFGAYSITKVFTERYYAGTGNGVTELAQTHGINLLWIEHESLFRFFFPFREVDIQSFFLHGHSTSMTILNRFYSLVHIPGTVLFLSWYYYSAPDHRTFAIARRTMTLGNFAAFVIFCFWPCMPPRLLPESYGFHDTVRQSNAESVWVGGKNVNQLAAMPSLHFTYAFVIGCTFIYHSGFIRRITGMKIRSRRQPVWREFTFLVAGIVYPAFVLLIIVATANHYFMDASVATLTVTLSFICNRVWNVLLPAEDIFCWVFRLEKPVPTTGMQFDQESERERTRAKALEA